MHGQLTDLRHCHPQLGHDVSSSLAEWGIQVFQCTRRGAHADMSAGAPVIRAQICVGVVGVLGAASCGALYCRSCCCCTLACALASSIKRTTSVTHCTGSRESGGCCCRCRHRTTYNKMCIYICIYIYMYIVLHTCMHIRYLYSYSIPISI